MSLGEGQVGMQQTAMLVLELRLSVSFKSFIIYGNGNRLSLSFVLFFFSIPKIAIYRIHSKCGDMFARRESPALPYH